MGYLRKGGTVCNPAKKSLTVFQNSYQETYYVTEQQPYTYYESVTTPVYASGSIYYETISNSYGYQGTLYNNTNATIEANMGGSGWRTIPPRGDMTFGGTNTNGYVKMNGVQIWGGGISPSSWSTAIWSGSPAIQIGTTTTQVPRTGYRDVQVPKTRTAWNTKWSKLSA